ncbi:FAA hydrolase family protein, partial [Roseomonas alkaliterrae]
MGLRLITFADAAGSRAGVLLDGGRVLDLGAAMPPARDMIALIEAGPAALAEVRALAADPPAGAVL